MTVSILLVAVILVLIIVSVILGLMIYKLIQDRKDFEEYEKNRELNTELKDRREYEIYLKGQIDKGSDFYLHFFDWQDEQYLDPKQLGEEL